MKNKANPRKTIRPRKTRAKSKEKKKFFRGGYAK